MTSTSFQLLTLDEYEARSGKKVAVGKRYFKHTRLADIVTSAGFAAGITEEARRLRWFTRTRRG